MLTETFNDELLIFIPYSPHLLMLFDCIFEVTPVEEMQIPFSLQFLIVLPLIVVAVPAVTYTPLPDVDVIPVLLLIEPALAFELT